MSGQAIARMIQRRCGDLGLNSRRYGGHSLRSGFMTNNPAANANKLIVD